MSFIAKNPLTVPEVDNSPSVPKPGTRGLFAGKDGWYDVDSSGNITKLGSNGESSGSGDKEIFTVYTESTIVGNGLSVSAATYDDILNAYNSGKIIRFLMENGFVVYPFVQYDRSENNLYFQYCIDNTWCVYMLGREDIETTTTMWQIASISAMNADLYEPFIGEMSELLFADSLVNAVNINHNNITENQTHITELYNQLDSRVHYEELEALQTQMGDIESALDGILKIQNTLMGGDAV